MNTVSGMCVLPFQSNFFLEYLIPNSVMHLIYAEQLTYVPVQLLEVLYLLSMY